MEKTMSQNDVEKYISGITYPADKQALIKKAKDRGAQESVISALNSIASRQYQSLDDVNSELK